LWDLYIGALLLFIYLINSLPAEADRPLLRISLIFLGMMSVYGLFWLGKKFITTPRLGRVKFGPERRKKKVTLGLILGGFVLVNLALLALIIALNRDLALRDTLRTWLHLQVTRLAMGAFVGLFVGSAMAFIAYYNDFPRGFYVAAMFAASFFLSEWLDNPLFFALAAALIMIPGVVLLVRFLQEHPLPVEK
jgi:uncharacterized PurR-regulated membrane protein YhhQ (DUF165 family)